MKNMSITAAAAALLAASSLAAAADEASGTITSIDTAGGSLTLSDGKVYFLPQAVAAAAASLVVGERVTVTYNDDPVGTMTATDVEPAA